MSKKKSMKYIPVLQPMQQNREEWADNAPRLTEGQKEEIQQITRNAYMKFTTTPITRNNFFWVHENLENELAEKMLEQFGLVAGVEWKGVFAPHVTAAMGRAGVKTPGFIDGFIPTPDFIESEIFDYIEVFQPRLVLFQFDEYDKYMKSVEQSVSEAEKRRAQGDIYYTDRDRQINYRPPADTDLGSTKESEEDE